MTSSLGTAAFPTDTADIARQPLQAEQCALIVVDIQEKLLPPIFNKDELVKNSQLLVRLANILNLPTIVTCLLYTSPSPRDGLLSRMPSSA